MDWVLIRGIVSEEFHWSDFPNQVKDFFGLQKIYCPDIVGNGKFFRQKSSINVSQNIFQLKEQVKSPNKKILVGFSLGAMLAVEWAYAYPEEIAGIVLINTSLSSSSFYERLKPMAFLRILSAAFVRDPIAREILILRLTTYLTERDIQKIALQWGERSKLYPVGKFNFFRQLVLANAIRQRPEPPPCKVLILNSKLDAVVSYKCSQNIAETWGAKLFVHPTAGHDLTLEDPNWVLSKISTFFNYSSEKNKIFLDQDK